MKRNQNVAIVSDFEWSLIERLKNARLRSYSAGKRFIRDISRNSKLSDRGRWLLASLLQTYRRQYALTSEQWAWVDSWLAKDVTLEPDSVPLRMEPDGSKRRVMPLPKAGKDELVSSSISSGWLFGDNKPERTTESK